MHSNKQIEINNTKTYSFSSREELLDYIKDQKKILIAINAEKILKKDEKLKNIINENIGFSDGIGAILALKKKGITNTVKIPGVELWLDIIKKFYKEKNFYFIGSTDEVINKTVSKLKNQFPSINIINHRNGFLKNNALEILKQDLIDKKPDIVFVAMGTPKQEYLMDELIKIHPALYMGLGGSFDVYCGKIKRAPVFFQKLSIEWLYRLLKEPARIKRQVVLLKLVWKLIAGKI